MRLEDFLVCSSAAGVTPTNLLFAAGLGVVLAEFWMAATHLPLAVQATRGDAPWGARCTTACPA
ncbi:MAG TPA: hypothetical protein VGR26_11640 [Acidimicrobiales bacterium]|nr:hypothetical protein [Acidimicrobiales bacterium]